MAEHKRFICAGSFANAMKLEETVRDMRLNRELEGVTFRHSRNPADGPDVYVLEGPAALRQRINQIVEEFDQG